AAAMEWLNTPHEVDIFGLTLGWPSFEFLAGFVGLTLYTVPFIAEEVRSGIRGVRQGQKQAALALGLTSWQSMRLVILPQAVKIALPPLLGQYMNVVKNSSLTMAIGVAELSFVSRQVDSQSLQTFAAFGLATVLYIVIIAFMEGWGQWRQQRQLAQGV
ncbi:TPA: ABC transporter permease subunit, partial [Providencia alcalifaciens]